MKLLFALLIFATSSAFAHGEDKLGPHGGFVRMPGGFHTELVPQGKSALKVYLLDIKWENPSVKNSDLKIKYIGKSTADADCKIQRDFYLCRFPKAVNLTEKGVLKVFAQREQQKGMEASYPLPFKLEIIDDEHGNHH